MEKIIDDFFSINAIISEQAKHVLMAKGEESLDYIINQFHKRSLNPYLEKQLGDIFGHFSNSALPKLLDIFNEGDWNKMVMAPPCFSKLPHEPAGSKLMEIVSSGYIDKERLAIEAIGYLGTPYWSYKLKDKITYNYDYDWEKLSGYIFKTFFRIATRATNQNEIRSSFFFIEEFYKLAGLEKFMSLWESNWYSMEIIFCDFKPVAADIIISDWLKNEESFFRELGLIALGKMRLNRSVKIIKQIALEEGQNKKIIRQCADSLSMINTISSSNAMKEIFQSTLKTDTIYNSVALFMAMTIFHNNDRKFVEKIYTELLEIGGQTEAHTLYNICFLGFDESIWLEGITSEYYIVRASVALAYGRKKGSSATQKLLLMEKESTHEIEKALILTALIVSGYTAKKEEFLSAIFAFHQRHCLRMMRITWKREIVYALNLVDSSNLEIWENMSGEEVGQILKEITEIENTHIDSIMPLINNPSNFLSTNNLSNEIFISYSWGGESEKIVDIIYDILTKNRFNIIRDKIALGYKGNIKEFMKDIGRGKYIIIIISDKYLKSDNCMFEMLELKKYGNLYERIFPIVLNDAKIYKESDRLDYLLYWDNEIKQLNKKVKELNNLSGTGKVIEKLNQYIDIRGIIDEITDLLRDMNTFGPDIHQNNNFSALTISINKAIAKDI